jgi:hypothetical protein
LRVGWTAVILLLAAFPFMRAMLGISTVLRTRYRRRHGLCVDCGYDLRGSLAAAVDRCPECGVVAAASR